MPMEAVGNLIEMNAHNVLSPTASALCYLGTIGIIVSVIVFFATILIKENVSRDACIIACAIAVAISLGLLISGNKMPKVKEINYCANGPVSIEQIAAVYDIVDIDGKQITVRERGKQA